MQQRRWSEIETVWEKQENWSIYALMSAIWWPAKEEKTRVYFSSLKTLSALSLQKSFSKYTHRVWSTHSRKVYFRKLVAIRKRTLQLGASWSQDSNHSKSSNLKVLTWRSRRHTGVFGGLVSHTLRERVNSRFVWFRGDGVREIRTVGGSRRRIGLHHAGCMKR